MLVSQITVPGTANEYVDQLDLFWTTPWHNGSDITKYQYRYAEGTSVPATAGWTDIPDSAPTGQNSNGYVVEGLAGGTQYTFEVRAVNGIGGGGEKAAMNTTPAPNWSFTLRDSASNDVTELTEGGDSATATVSITNNVTFSTDQTVTLAWGLDLSTGLIRGAGNATTITIGDGESSGSLEINAIQIATDSYDPPYTTDLVATLGGTEIASIELTRVDAQNPPVATITEVPSSVNEGENIEVEITLAPPLSSTTGAHHRIVKFTVSDAASALSGTVPPSTSFSPNQGSKTVTLTAADNSTMNDGGRDITFTLALNPDAPYTLGTPSSATVTVRDDDTPPLAPENLRAQAGNTEAILGWDAPPASTPDHGQPVLHYESRVQAGTAAFGSWTTIPNSDATTGSHTFTGLTNGTVYTYEVRAENVAGDGAEAQVAVTPIVGVAVSFGAATLSVDEGGTGQATLTLATAPAAGATATVPLVATPGEGLGTGEYSGVPASVTFAAGETSKSFTVSGVQDTLDEPDEVLTLSLGTLPAGYVAGTTAELAITVVDDDVAQLEFTLRDSGGNDVTELVEGGASATATVSITNDVRFSTDRTVTLAWGTVDLTVGSVVGAGGATAITISAEQASGSLEISSPQHAAVVYDRPQTYPLSATLGDTELGSIDLTRLDDEDPPVASITQAPTTVTEGENIEIEVALSVPYAGSGPIRLTVTDGSGALSGTLPDRVDLAAVVKMRTITLATDDNSVQNDGAREVTVTLGLSTDIPYTLGTPSSVTITVRDDDTPPLAPQNLAAQAGNTEARLTWQAPLPSSPDHGQPVLRYEYRVQVGSGSFGNWTTVPNSDATTTGHTFTGLANDMPHTYEVRAANVAGGGAAARRTVTPIVGVAVSFAAATLSVDEGESATVTLTLASAPSLGTTVTVPIVATRGTGLDSSEYSGVPASVIFTTAETSFTVSTVEDTADEPDAVLTLTFGTLPAGYVPGTPARLELTVVDDDAPIVSATFGRAAATVTEGGSVAVTVRLSQAPEREVVLPLTATRGANLAATEVDGVPASVTFAADATQARFTATFADDAVVEGNETLTLTFGTYPERVQAGANPRLVLTVEDDDGPPAAPADLAARTGDGYAALSWTAVANDSPVLRYEVRWRETDGAPFGAWRSVGLETSHRVEELTNDTPYEFAVRAVNAHGDGESTSAPGTPTERITGIPKAPQWLRVNATDSARAELKWGRPSNGTDKVTANGPNATFAQIQGYRIEVCRTACGGADAEWHAAVANTGEFEHTHTHQVLAPGVIRENHYRVQAININGRTGPYSNTATLEATRLERFWLVSPNSSTVDVHLEVWHPDGNPLHVRYADTSDPMSVRYAEQRLTKQGYPVIGLPVEASTHYEVEVDFAATFDSPRLRSATVWSLREGADPYTSPYAVDALDAQVHRGGSWREAPDTQLTVRMGESGRYRLRLKPCAGERTVIARRIEAPAGALRASPMEVDPFPMDLRCGGDEPGAWQEVTVTALALADYDADMRAEALLRTPFAVVYNHEVWRDTGTTTSTLVSEGTGLVRAAVARPAGATLATPAGVAIADPAAGGSGPVMTWNAVGGATEYLVNWRYGVRYASGANADRSRQTDTGTTIPFGASRRGPITARVRAFSGGGVSDWSAERTWDSRPPTLSVLDTAVNEDDGSVGFLVKLDPAASGTVTVDYATRDDGTAVAGTDYTATSGTLTFAPGERERKTPLVAIVDDDEEDSGETFRLVLSNPTGSDADNGAAVLGDAEAVATILNSERAAARPTGFTLVDAGTNADLMALADGATVALGDLMASSYGIRAETSAGAAPGSVRLELAGAKTVARTDDAAPYSLYGDGGGRINGASLPAGSYTLTATSYADSGGRGDELGSLTVSFAAAAGALAAATPGPFEVAEGGTAVATLAATETGTGETATWSIPEGTAGGADGEAFALTAGGALSLAAAKDFEAPDDADGDGAYAVTVAMAAGAQTATVDLLVTLTNVNEAPVAKASATPHKVREGVEVTLDGSASADPDADDTLSHAWTQTEDGPRVTLSDAAAARTTFTSPSDLEAETELAFTLRVTDAGGLHAEDTATVTVTLVSEVSIAAAAEYPAEGDGRGVPGDAGGERVQRADGAGGGRGDGRDAGRSAGERDVRGGREGDGAARADGGGRGRRERQRRHRGAGGWRRLGARGGSDGGVADGARRRRGAGAVDGGGGRDGVVGGHAGGGVRRRLDRRRLGGPVLEPAGARRAARQVAVVGPARAGHQDRLRRRPGRRRVADAARRRPVGRVPGELGRRLELQDRERRCLVDRRRDAGGAGVEAVGRGAVDRRDARVADGVGRRTGPGVRRRGAGVPGGGRRGHGDGGGRGGGRRRGGGLRAGRGRRRGGRGPPGGGARRGRDAGRGRGDGGGRHGAPLPGGAGADGRGVVQRGADRVAGDRRHGRGGRNADGVGRRRRGRRRPRERDLRLPVAGERRRAGRGDRGRDRNDLRAGSGGRRQDAEGAGRVHRRRRHGGDARQRRDGGGRGPAPDGGVGGDGGGAGGRLDGRRHGAPRVRVLGAGDGGDGRRHAVGRRSRSTARRARRRTRAARGRRR